MGSGHAICADDFRASVRSKLFHATGTCQTLAYAIVGDHQLLRRYGHFSVATLCKVLRAAIEDDGETKTATNGAVPENITHHVNPCSTSHPKAV